MAGNIVHEDGDQLYVTVTEHIGAGANPKSGDPVRVGQLPGVAVTDEDADGKTTVKFNGTARLSVTGADGAGDTAIAVGDIVYFDGAGSQINADDTNGVRFGYALEPVASGATATILVKIGY